MVLGKEKVVLTAHALMNVNPFTIAVPQAALDDLQMRLAQTRWPDEIPGSGWSYGSNLAYMKEVVSYWQTTFDWRREGQQLTRLAHFCTLIHGMGLPIVY